ncbi:hypothetical protein, partial [Streptosporangium sp. NPDC002607]
MSGRVLPDGLFVRCRLSRGRSLGDPFVNCRLRGRFLTGSFVRCRLSRGRSLGDPFVNCRLWDRFLTGRVPGGEQVRQQDAPGHPVHRQMMHR